MVVDSSPKFLNLERKAAPMRVVQSQQMSIGEVDVSRITFDAKSRDDIPKILKGLQYLYMQGELRTSVFDLLNRQIAPAVNKANGRPGMTP